MRTVNKLLFFPALVLLTSSLASCQQYDKDTVYLKVLNSEDYIDKTLLTDFENEMASKGKKVKVVYDTFDTMENMFNTLKTGKTDYDLVCASDYMIQKLVNNNLVIKIDHTNKVKNYDTYASTFIRDQLASVTWSPSEGKTVNLDEYSECYMWGTLGIIYNPKYYTNLDPKTDFADWKNLWNDKYQRTISIKDSMRDTYAIGLIKAYENELAQAKDVKARTEIFNRGGEEDKDAVKHINEVKEQLQLLKNNIFGFEVDSGKDDIVTGKIGADTAWSGDAIYSMTRGEGYSDYLCYSLPEQGTNMWFDCWAMLDDHDKSDDDIAYAFLDFLAKPNSAIRNMGLYNEEEKRYDGIGYTSAIAGDEVFEYYKEKYGPTKVSNNTMSYSLDYFFGGDHTLDVDQTKYDRGLIKAQFPEEEYISKLMIMKDYGANSDMILKMWQDVKHDPLPTWAIALFIVEVALIATGATILIVVKLKNKNRRKARREKAVKQA